METAINSYQPLISQGILKRWFLAVSTFYLHSLVSVTLQYEELRNRTAYPLFTTIVKVDHVTKNGSPYLLGYFLSNGNLEPVGLNKFDEADVQSTSLSNKVCRSIYALGKVKDCIN